jgi:hypothetical protein
MVIIILIIIIIIIMTVIVPDRTCASILTLKVYANPIGRWDSRWLRAVAQYLFTSGCFNCGSVGKVSHRTQEGLASWQPNARYKLAGVRRTTVNPEKAVGESNQL